MSPIEQFYNIVKTILNWCANTTILSFGEVHFTFLNIAVGSLAFMIVLNLVNKIFWDD